MKTRLCDNMLLVLILIMVQMNRVHSQDPQWPVHTVCNSERITVTYRSCGEISVTYTTVQQFGPWGTEETSFFLTDPKLLNSDPLQDVGFTLLPCPERLTDPIKIRLALILRQSIDELYSSYELWLNGHTILKQDEPLCLPHFPRFKFCGSRRGEIITVESSFKSKIDLPLKADFDLKLRAINQDGFLIACVNATLSFH